MGSGYQEIAPVLPVLPEEMYSIRDKFRNWVYSEVGVGLGNGPGDVLGYRWATDFLTTEPPVHQSAMDKFAALLAAAPPPDLDDLEDYIHIMMETGVPGHLDAEPPIFTLVDTTVDAIAPTGLPSNLDARYTATLADVDVKLVEELALRMEEKNVTGGRYSSGAAWAVALATQKAITEWGASRSAEALTAVENATQRRVASAQVGIVLGQALDDRQFAELTSYDRSQERRISAFQWWVNLFRIPLDTASMASHYAMQEWNAQLTAVQNEFQAWQVKQPENNPALKLAYGYSTTYPASPSAPSIVENPWLGLLSGVASAAGAVATAAMLL